MADRTLSHGDTGDDVKSAQLMLNRNGALLEADGQFGPGTENAVREFQSQAALPVTGQIDDPSWGALRQLPDPCPDIDTEAVTFIAQKEISSRAYYDSTECRPSYPGGASGITIGVGYDLRFEPSFDDDWGGLLPAATMVALRACAGKQGDNATVAQLSGLTVPWGPAWTVYVHKSLPVYAQQTRDAFPGFDDLDPLCRGALVSLVYNRGTGMDDDPPGSGNRQEMRDIRAALAAGNPAAVPDALRAMKRLWPNTRGLRDRRDQEAALFEEGMARAAGGGSGQG